MYLFYCLTFNVMSEFILVVFLCNYFQLSISISIGRFCLDLHVIEKQYKTVLKDATSSYSRIDETLYVLDIFYEVGKRPSLRDAFAQCVDEVSIFLQILNQGFIVNCGFLIQYFFLTIVRAGDCRFGKGSRRSWIRQKRATTRCRMA